MRLQPELAESHYNQGVTLQSDGQLDRAIAAYREAIRLKPDYVIAYNNLGEPCAARSNWTLPSLPFGMPSASSQTT